MPVFQVTTEMSDLCGNSWLEGNSWFVTADKIQDVEAAFPKYRGFIRFHVTPLSVMPLAEAILDAKHKQLL